MDVLAPRPGVGAVAAGLPSGVPSSDVQSAVDGALPGDTVAVRGGSWSEDVRVPTSDPTLRGYGASTPTLDDGGVGVTLRSERGEPSLLDRIRTGGAVERSGWRDIDASRHPTTFDGNTARGRRRAAGVGTEVLHLVDCARTENAADRGGALPIDGSSTGDVVKSDLGTGADHHVPDDVNGPAASGSAASFACSGGACR